MKNNKEDEKIKKFLKSKMVLLVTESPTDRTAWKKLFVELGTPLNNFHNASTVRDGNELIDTKRVDIVITSLKLGNEMAFSMMENHLDKYPDRSEYFCFFVSEKNSLTVSALIAELAVDSLIMKPYNQQDLIDNVKETMISAVNMSKEMKRFHQILGDIRSNEFGSALEASNGYMENLPNSPNGYYLNGMAKKGLGEVEEAIDVWKTALEKKSDHYQTLCSLFDAYAEKKSFSDSYKIGEVLTAEYPINPIRIPNLIRASLATHNYMNLIKFCEMIIELDEDLDTIRKPIAAALALSGKSLIKEDKSANKTLSLEISKKGIQLTEPQSFIHLTCLENLYELGEYEEVKNLLDLIPSDEIKSDFVGLELLVLEKTEKMSDVFVHAQKMVKEDFISPVVYEVLVRSAKEIGKSKTQLEDIVFEASKKFPEIKDNLQAMIS